jgi:hypothetical protein
MWFNIFLASLLHQHMVSSLLKATANLDAFLAHTPSNKHLVEVGK